MLKPDFWHDKTNSKNILKEKKLFENLINSFYTIEKKLSDLDELNQLAIVENNNEIQNEVIDKIKKLKKKKKKKNYYSLKNLT